MNFQVVRENALKYLGYQAPMFEGLTPGISSLLGECIEEIKQIAQPKVIVVNVDTEIIGCPIIREEDGLAKSSRNTYLSADERQAALVLSRSLKIGKQLVDAGEKSAKAVKDAITAEINKEPLAKIDYVDVVDFDTITPVDEIKGTTLVAIAVYIGKTRLIDNFIA